MKSTNECGLTRRVSMKKSVKKNLNVTIDERRSERSTDRTIEEWVAAVTSGHKDEHINCDARKVI